MTSPESKIILLAGRIGCARYQLEEMSESFPEQDFCDGSASELPDRIDGRLIGQHPRLGT
jgi:hypothetical protein